jgi:serine/threonine-protein kinase
MLEQLLNSRYQKLRILGSSPNGRSFLAKDHKALDNDQCLIIQIHSPTNDTFILEKVRNLVAQEVSRLFLLNKSCQIPKLLDHFEEKGAFYLVQEFIEGTSLKTELENKPPFSQDKLVKFLQISLTILNLLHEKGIIHQDIKPDNWIYQQSDSQLFLVGLGKIKSQDNNLAATMPIDYRCYLAPEQLRNHPQMSSDIYALGMIAIQALTGINPINFTEDEQGKFLWESYTSISVNLEKILNKMTSHNLKTRYSCAKEVLTDLAYLYPTPTEILHPSYSATSFSAAIPVTTVSSNETKMNPCPILQPTEASGSPNLSSIAEIKHSSLENSIPAIVNISLSQKLLNFAKSSQGKVMAICLCLGLAFWLIMQVLEITKKKQIDTIINQIELSYSNGDYQKCISQSNAIDTIEIGVSEEKRIELSNKCVLQLAIQQAELFHYEEAIVIAIRVPNNSPNYQTAQNYIDNWSLKILEKTNQFYQDTGDLHKAIELIKVIPETSPIKKKALDFTIKWQNSYQSESGKTTIDLCQVNSTLCNQ